ncbi:hypothetical protein [Actinomadura latina]|uniref:DUF3558 domain-containing protein n=1 Tax=Actinomadura latina TaxID=163603 RepID=A0A846Z8P9_9ACTN|nr:hypothetical protein [Actinomadura latina]NKZ07134.1 hypothetical protein [Actinomadura latina]
MSGSHRSGSDRDSYRGSGGGQGPGGGYRPDGGAYGTGGGEYTPSPGLESGGPSGTGGQQTGGYRTGGYPTAGSETGGYETGGYGSGQSGSGPYQRGGAPYQRDSGAYRPESGSYGPAESGSYGAGESGSYGAGETGKYRSEPGSYQRETGAYRREASPYQRGSGPYQRETGPYETGSGGYRSGSGGYGSGGYGSDTGGYRAGGSGRRRADSGGYRTGSHRVARDGGGRRWGVILGGIVAGIAVCVLAMIVILGGVGASGDKDGGDIVGSGAAESSPTAKGERSVVPDSCTIVGQDLIDRLAPGSERTQADSYQSSERQNQCVWGAYAGDTKRQLTVELRAIAGNADQTPTDAATRTFTSERTADESGKALLPDQKLTEKLRLENVGDDGYIVYSVDDKQGAGEAVGNVRLANILVTIHYSGSNDGDPLSSKSANGGATDVAKAVIQALNQG